MRRTKGFTLVEMLAVVIIIAALVAIAIPALFSAINDARSRTCAANIKNIESAEQLYFSKNQAYVDFATVSTNVAYFPDGAPVCPFAKAYTVATGTGLVNNKATHFTTGDLMTVTGTGKHLP